MIIEHCGIAVDFSRIKAIRRESASPGGYLIFELDNLIHLYHNEENGKLEIHSLPNEPIKHRFDTWDSLETYYDEWVGIWEEVRKNVSS